MEKNEPQVEPAQVDVVEPEATSEPKVDEKDVQSLMKEIDEVKRQARKWEERAKENKDAKPQLDEAKQQLDNLQKEYQTVKEQLDTYMKEKERNDLISRVSAETGLPASVIGAMKADTEEELLDVANMVKKNIPLYPQDVNDGAQHVDMKLSRAEIAKIKNPHEREKAILENLIKE